MGTDIRRHRRVSIVRIVAAAIAVGVSLALAVYDPVLPGDVPRLEPKPDHGLATFESARSG